MHEKGGNEGREKYWKELSAEEKIERMRQEVLRTQRQLEEIYQVQRILNQHFDRHIHQDGKIFVPKENFFESLGQQIGKYSLSVRKTSGNPDEVYF